MNIYRIKLITLVLLIILPVQNVLAESNLYKAGVVFYNQGKYQEALMYLSDSVKKNPDDIDSLYYFANTLVKTNNIDIAQKYYKRIIDIDPDYYISDYARKALADIADFKRGIRTPYSSFTQKGSRVYSSANSYISNVTESGTLIHWDKLVIPLKVYIKPPKFNEHKKYALDAFDEWQKMTGVVAFDSAISEEAAHIVVDWGGKLYKEPSYDFYGFAEPEIEGNELLKYNIFIQETDKKGKLLSPGIVRLALLHQIGHSLGINAHSNDKNDVMYVSPEATSLSKQDSATINLLYEMPATISNFSQAAAVRSEIAKKEAESEAEEE